MRAVAVASAVAVQSGLADLLLQLHPQSRFKALTLVDRSRIAISPAVAAQPSLPHCCIADL